MKSVMEESAQSPIELRALECLGKGFDLTSDFRLRFAKGIGDRRLVALDEENKRDILIPGGATIRGVSEDIRCDKGDRIRFKSDVLEFNQVSFPFFFFFFPPSFLFFSSFWLVRFCCCWIFFFMSFWCSYIKYLSASSSCVCA